MNKAIFPNWGSLSSPQNLKLPHKYLWAYKLCIAVVAVMFATCAYEIYEIQQLKTEQTTLNARLASVQAKSAYINDEGKRLSQSEAQFEHIYPYISKRYSTSQFFGALANTGILPEHCYLSKVSIKVDSEGLLDTSVGLISNTSQPTQASQDMDKLRSGVLQLLNTAIPNMITGEYQLQSYKASGNPVVRSTSDTKEVDGVEVSETWKYSVKVLSPEEVVRTYGIIKNNFPIKR